MTVESVLMDLAAVSLPLWLVVEAALTRSRRREARRAAAPAPREGYAAEKPRAARPLTINAR
jgi:hypothetical protein